MNQTLQQNNGQKKTDPLKSLDLQYGYEEEPEEESKDEGSDWFKGLLEYIKSRKMAQVQQVAE